MSTAAAPEAAHEELVRRLRRAEGQLRGVQRMLAEDADCKGLLTQLAAVKAAVDQVGLHLISEQLRACAAGEAGDCGAAFEDAVGTFLRYTTLAR